MERNALSNKLLLLLIIGLFCSCDRKITGCYSSNRFFKTITLGLSVDSCFSYNSTGYEIAGTFSNGRYFVDSNHLILNTTIPKITDSIQIISTYMNFNGFKKMIIHYIRSCEREPHGVMMRVKNSLIDTLFYTLCDTIILFDKNIDESILKKYVIGIEAFDIKDIHTNSSALFITDNKEYPMIIDTSADNYNISLYSSRYDSLRKFRFFKDERWKIKRNRIFDPMTGDVFKKNKKIH